jgi:hypothetical protein
MVACGVTAELTQHHYVTLDIGAGAEGYGAAQDDHVTLHTAG